MEILKRTINIMQCDYDERKISYEEFVQQIKKRLLVLRTNKKMLYFIGNGGSAGISVHMTVDYLKNGRIKTHSMHDAAILTCLGNDFGYENIFEKQIEIIAESGDLLVAISSSGNSQNIIKAIEVAKCKNCEVITFSGFDKNNSIRNLGKYNLYVPSMEYGIVESIHNLVLQQIVDEIYFSDKNKSLEEKK